MLSPVDDVLDTLAEVGVDRSHLVGASFGAAVAVEAALTRPPQVASLLLSPRVDHSSQSSRRTCAFIETESAALARGDLGDAVEANLTWWVDGPNRETGDVDPTSATWVD
jgi:3-oxoadipate enol-lactonase